MKKTTNSKITVKDDSIYIKPLGGLECVEIHHNADEYRGGYIAYTCYSKALGHRHWSITSFDVPQAIIGLYKTGKAYADMIHILEDKPLYFDWAQLRSKKKTLAKLAEMEQAYNKLA